MQKVTLRKVKTPVGYMQDGEEDILHFSLDGLLPEGTILSLNTILGTLSLLRTVDGSPRHIAEEQFTTSELCVLMPLLEAHPYYTPHEVILTSFTNGRVTETGIARCRERLEEARRTGVYEQEIRPIRNTLSRTRLKTLLLGIDISSILETGYILMKANKKREPRAIEPPPPASL